MQAFNKYNKIALCAKIASSTYINIVFMYFDSITESPHDEIANETESQNNSNHENYSTPIVGDSNPTSSEDNANIQEDFIQSIREGNMNVFIDMLNRRDEIGLDLQHRDDNGHTVLRIAIDEGYSGK